MPHDLRLILFALAALAAAVSVSESLTRPICRKSRVEYAVRGAGAVAQAAELARNLEDDPSYCPTLAELVASRRLDEQKTGDPWGRPYRVQCSSDEAHAWSNGTDGLPGSDDDISERMDRAALQRAIDADRPWYRR